VDDLILDTPNALNYLNDYLKRGIEDGYLSQNDFMIDDLVVDENLPSPQTTNNNNDDQEDEEQEEEGN